MEMAQQFRWWHKGDLDGFFGLFVDNLIQLILIVVLCGAILHMPGEMIYGYEDNLKAIAPTRQLAIVNANDPTADYTLKIYLSALGDYSGTLMLYVADVFDRAGVRVHRISGQINAGGSLNDPWSNIKDTGAVSQAAQETVDALGNWAHG